MYVYKSRKAHRVESRGGMQLFRYKYIINADTHAGYDIPIALVCREVSA